MVIVIRVEEDVALLQSALKKEQRLRLEEEERAAYAETKVRALQRTISDLQDALDRQHRAHGRPT
jgi:hypothetical protein